MKREATVAFIGGGNMARALIAGLLRQGFDRGRIRVGETLPEARSRLQQDFGIVALADNAAVVAGAALLVLAVKPQDAATALRGIGPAGGERPTLLSIAAGLRIADLTRLAPGWSIVRAMPNRPALVGAGVTGLFAAAEVSVAERQLAASVAAAVGGVVWLEQESHLDVVTALSGSGPAYFFLLAEHLALAGEQLGLKPQIAMQLAAQTLYGAGMLAQDETDLAAQRSAVTSRGGTTEAALMVLREGGFQALVARALEAATQRSSELGEAVHRATVAG